jgi:hypothetical protein
MANFLVDGIAQQCHDQPPAPRIDTLIPSWASAGADGPGRVLTPLGDFLISSEIKTKFSSLKGGWEISSWSTYSWNIKNKPSPFSCAVSPEPPGRCGLITTVKFLPSVVANSHPMYQFSAMPIYLFWSQSDLAIFGFTLEPAGKNLPPELAPWLKNGDGSALHAGAEDDLAANAVVRAIQRDGFYLACTRSLKFTSLGHSVH